MITQTIEIVVQLERDPVSGRRRVTHIFEVTGLEGETIGGQDLWLIDPAGERLRWTGTRPKALDKIVRAGIPYALPHRHEGAGAGERTEPGSTRAGAEWSSGSRRE